MRILPSTSSPPFHPLSDLLEEGSCASSLNAFVVGPFICPIATTLEKGCQILPRVAQIHLFQEQHSYPSLCLSENNSCSNRYRDRWPLISTTKHNFLRMISNNDAWFRVSGRGRSSDDDKASVFNCPGDGLTFDGITETYQETSNM
ncbi:uncharacterized protein LOC131068878 [Cryptomeria japonica]|uniref:uncharacterized protein LOC131068878 n=1 Tax=Cryptomeria japonica TaxID=3369 RepID=UPI0027DA0334|nr:uncharacterized protein LOC131068878 [Cryptomeria japonica]